MDLQGKVAVITGVSKGIGYETSLALLNKGVIVYGLGRNNNDISHPDFHFSYCDVRNWESVQQAFKPIIEKHGAVDILLNNAGLGYFGFLEDMSVEIWHEMFETNVNGMFYCTKMVLPGMKSQQRGHILNISSIAGLEGMPQVAGYCGTKWAVKGISESLFKEVRDDKIKVTCIYPGSTKTDFFRNSPSIKAHDYMIMPEDIARTIVQALEMPDNFHTVNIEIRPLQPKGPKTK